VSDPGLAAGGAQVSDHQFGTFVADVMTSGARGLAAGRNIFMAADPAAKVREVRRLLSFPIDDSHLQDTPPLAASGNGQMGIPTTLELDRQERVR